MKLNKKSRDKIFDLHLGLTFDWRETGLLRWRIFLWMLFFGVCAFAAGLFVHVWADPVTAGPTGEMGVTLPSPRSADTPLAPLPPVSVPTVADQVWRMWQHPDFHIRAMMNPSLEISGTCIPYLSFCSPGLDGRIVTAGSLSGFSRSEDHTGLRSDFFVVVDVWGVPSQVLLLESSGSNGADESAMRFARSLRWVPSREPRSGTMSIEWKEEEP